MPKHFTNVIDRHNIVVFDLGSRGNFATKTFQEVSLLIGLQMRDLIWPDQLQRDNTSPGGALFGLIDDAHPPLAENL
nr:hypothetical protein [Blastopirellula marina]